MGSKPPTNKGITATWWQHTKIVGKNTKENLSASSGLNLQTEKSLKLECHIWGKVTGLERRVSHPSINQARPCLASEIRRDRARSGWYGRRQKEG